MRTNKITVDINGIDLDIEYVVSGKYMPATRYDPEEYPEVEIYNICVSDSKIDIQDLLSEYQMEIINQAIFDNHE